MKKNILIISLICIFAIGLTSCGKNKEKTNTEKLCIEKGWVLSEATAAPYYKMADGTKITDIYKDYLYDYEQDDIIYFYANGSQVINPGKLTPKDDEDGYASEQASTWFFNSDETTLTFQIPFFYESKIPARTFDAEQETVKISSLTADKLVVLYTFNVVDTKEECTFTLTYVPAK